MKNTSEPKLTFLSLTIKQHPLFEKNTTFSLINDSRVSQDKSERLTNLIGRIWVNNLVAIVGKNATGKTILMKTLIGLQELLLENKSIDQTALDEILIGNKTISFDLLFCGSDNYAYKDEITFSFDSDNQNWFIKSEKVYQKHVAESISKNNLLKFDKAKLVIDRSKLEDITAALLSRDDSIFRLIIAQQRYQIRPVEDTLSLTNTNSLSYTGESVPGEILNFLDSTVEYLKIKKTMVDGIQRIIYRLKFKNSSEVFVENNFASLEHYLSSGTAKGITLYGKVIKVLKNGGMIFIDELENHFNHAIVQSFIEYFSDKKINQNRATLIFSTHYSELLDDLERGDEIYIAKRDKKISLQRYSAADVRSDLSKTEVFDSNFLGGTAPDYEAYMAVKKIMENNMKDIY